LTTALDLTTTDMNFIVTLDYIGHGFQRRIHQ